MIPAISGAIGPLGAGEWSVGGVGSAGGAAATGTGAAAGGSGSFGGALSSAINSLESTQANATNAAQGLATGQVSDPTQAVTAVENASLSMDLASQIRDKLVSAEGTIFNTQV
jgi:flagellar hook-basal body complex protein FliE